MSDHWLYFSLIGFVLQIWNCISILFLPESPRLLIELQRLDEARESLQKIADWNKVKLEFNEADFLRPKVLGEDKSKTGLPLSFWLKQRRIRINVIVMAFVWLTTSFNFYLIAFLNTSFEQVYLVTIFSCISDMLAYTSGGIILQYLGVRKT